LPPITLVREKAGVEGMISASSFNGVIYAFSWTRGASALNWESYQCQRILHSEFREEGRVESIRADCSRFAAFGPLAGR
jgi:hypothetical protein